MRNAFLKTIMECAEQDPRVALLMAEVGFSVVEPFEQAFPDRFYNTGISEQSMILTAAGMAAAGMRPIAYSMSCFLPSRAFELIKTSICYQNLPVTLVGIGAGLSYGEMGATHHAPEESALMRTLPNMTVLFPADAAELRACLRWALTENHGPVYISFPKLPAPTTAERLVTVGKATLYRAGSDGTIFAAGFAVHEAVKAAEILSASGTELQVYGLHAVKPLDREAVRNACAMQNLFVADEHYGCGGVAGEIAKAILESGGSVRRFQDLSLPDAFPEKVATYAEMIDQYGLTAEGMARRIAAAMGG